MTTFDLIIRNGKIVTADSIVSGDIAVKEGKMVEVSADKAIEGTAVKEKTSNRRKK